MKRIFLISALFVSLSVSAQYTPFNPDAVTSATQQASAKDAQTPKAKPKKAKPAKPVMMIKEKYAVQRLTAWWCGAKPSVVHPSRLSRCMTG